VGDHDDGLAEFADRGAQQGEDLGAGGGVEVAGGLVPEHHVRAGEERPRHRDALLLPAGELVGLVGEAVGEGQRGGDLLEPGAVHGAARQVQREEDVLLRREGGDEVVGLEDEADAVAAEVGERGVVEGGDLGAGDGDGAGVCGVQPGEAVHEGGLARAGGAHDRGEAGTLEVDVHAVKGVHRGLARAIGLHQGAGGHGGERPRPRGGGEGGCGCGFHARQPPAREGSGGSAGGMVVARAVYDWGMTPRPNASPPRPNTTAPSSCRHPPLGLQRSDSNQRSFNLTNACLARI